MDSGSPVSRVLRDYVALTKPRIIFLLLITAVGSMFLASEGWPDPLLAALVVVGGYLAAGGANALNHSLEGDIDQRMQRTHRRPVASGRVSQRQAFVFGIALNLAAFAILALFVNVLSAVLAISGTLIYIFVYTKGLKRTTPQNIVIGGAAGAVPPLVGWAAVTGTLELPAYYLFAIIFLWTPPHFWALALLIKDDYARAGIPMLPVVSTLAETKRQILLYTVVLVAFSASFAATGAVGWIYLSGALALGGGFIVRAVRLAREDGIEGAKALYVFSIAYLALLFGVAIADSLAHRYMVG
ncbi:MAG: heme o synthase [bacterium]|nr:heme o synthase [bacterium]MDE0600825.1 heme o synthase [bacterium]